MIEIALPWPVGLSPNRARRGPMSARTGHEQEDRDKARILTLALGLHATFPDGFIPVTLTSYFPYERHLDALSFHFSLKAQLDGVADALGLDDWRWWPVTLTRGEMVRGGRVVVRLG